MTVHEKPISLYLGMKLLHHSRGIQCAFRCFLIVILLTKLTTIAAQPALQINELQKNFFVYTTFNTYLGKKFPANGLYVVTSQGVIIIDTPWDTTQFQVLLDTIVSRHGLRAIMCLSTHFHEDRTGGLNYFKNTGMATYTTSATDNISAEKGFPRATHLMHQDTVFKVGEVAMEVFYPGPGHTLDNIVVWFPRERILYGGCLIKSTDDSTLGNTKDGNLQEYAASVRRVKKRFLRPIWVIPGHQSWNNNRSVEHTLRLAKKYNSP
jgi:metallo-beta-lactamase class B